VLGHLARLGYGGHFRLRDRLVPIAELDPALHQRDAGERFWDARDYVNEFVLTFAGAPRPGWGPGPGAQRV